MNLENLIAKLTTKYNADPNLDLMNLVNVVKSYQADDYYKFIEFSEKGYKRVLLHQTDEFEVLLICWAAQQASGFHLHSSNGCIMKVLQGELTEERKNQEGNIKVFQYKSNQSVYMSNKLGKHKVYNHTNKNAVSLHIYSPPGFGR